VNANAHSPSSFLPYFWSIAIGQWSLTTLITQSLFNAKFWSMSLKSQLLGRLWFQQKSNLFYSYTLVNWRKKIQWILWKVCLFCFFRNGQDTRLNAVATGSHIDAIPFSGKYDGVVGVLGALEAINVLKRYAQAMYTCIRYWKKQKGALVVLWHTISTYCCEMIGCNFDFGGKQLYSGGTCIWIQVLDEFLQPEIYT